MWCHLCGMVKTEMFLPDEQMRVCSACGYERPERVLRERIAYINRLNNIAFGVALGPPEKFALPAVVVSENETVTVIEVPVVRVRAKYCPVHFSPS